MSWRKRSRRRRQRERPFQRRLTYETVKDGTGRLIDFGEAGLGPLANLLTSRWGVPRTLTLTVGHAVAALLKGWVNAGLDQRRESREQAGGTDRAADAGAENAADARADRTADARADRTADARADRTADAGGAPDEPPTDRPVQPLFRPLANPHRTRYGGYGRRRRRHPPHDVAELLAVLDRVAGQFHQASRQLAALAAEMYASRDSLLALLRGGRSDLIEPVLSRLATAHQEVGDASGLLRRTAGEVGRYRSAF